MATARGARPMTAQRKQRHLRILELISTRRIHTQEELVDALARRRLGGDPVLREPRHRVAPPGEVRRRLGRPPAGDARAADPDELRIREGVLQVDTAGDSLVVLHTPPGEANRVAVAMDRLGWPEVVGTHRGRRHDFHRGPERRSTAAGGAKGEEAREVSLRPRA